MVVFHGSLLLFLDNLVLATLRIIDLNEHPRILPRHLNVFLR